jgi:hypothetical protein
MAYFITGFSSVPRYYPQFDLINEDGTKYTGFQGRNTMGLKMGHRLDETTDPPLSSIYRFAKLAGSTKILPDIFLVGGEICVNEKIKDIIEAIEPSVHQFLPITLMRTKKQVFKGSYYLLIIGQALNSVIFEESNLRWQVSLGGSKYAQPGLSPRDYRTLWKSQIEGKHLWRERIYLRDIYISDQLYNKIMTINIKGIDSKNYKKVVEK